MKTLRHNRLQAVSSEGSGHDFAPGVIDAPTTPSCSFTSYWRPEWDTNDTKQCEDIAPVSRSNRKKKNRKKSKRMRSEQKRQDKKQEQDKRIRREEEELQNEEETAKMQKKSCHIGTRRDDKDEEEQLPHRQDNEGTTKMKKKKNNKKKRPPLVWPCRPQNRGRPRRGHPPCHTTPPQWAVTPQGPCCCPEQSH